MTDNRLKPGDTAPAFSLQDANGQTVSLSDYVGEKVIIYFYPKAMTPGCTTQACDFRDRLERFTADGYRILGISPIPSINSRNSPKQKDSIPMLADQTTRWLRPTVPGERKRTTAKSTRDSSAQRS